MTWHMIYSEEGCTMCIWEECVSCSLSSSVLYVFVVSSWFMCCSTCFPTHLLSGCSIYYLEWDTDISNCYLEVFICPFNSVSLGFRYFDLLLGVNLYNYVSFCYVEPLLIYWYTVSFVSWNFFDLKSIMFDSH